MKIEISKFELQSLPLLLLLCLMANLVVCKANLAADEATLLAIKTHVTLSQDHILALNWTTSVSVCKWVGVSCGRRHERVTALDLSNMDLTATIPPCIANLSFLTSVALSNNSFYGRLPSELARLRRLKYLSLWNNSLVGTIPSALFINASKLEYLYLGKNSLHGSIPNEIGKLAKLREFGARDNRFSGSLPLSFTNMTALQMIDVAQNSLSGSLPDRLCDSRNLEILSATANFLHGHLPTDLQNCSNNLRVLSLSNAFTGNIPRSIGNLTRLEQLFLYVNKLEGVIPEEIGEMRGLKILNLGVNRLTGTIPKAIFNMSNAKVIALAENFLTGHLPSNIGHGTPKLEELCIERNALTGMIPESISNASQIKTLDMGSNSFSGSIPWSITSLQYLRWLGLYSNSLSVESPTNERDFFSSLGNCKGLTRLLLSHNPLRSVFSSLISNLSFSLEYFHASDCGLFGEIPPGIGNLSNLLEMNIDKNELSGRIPTTIGKLKNLQAVYLSSNKLKGSIPSELCTLTALGNIQLGGNALNGGLPVCLSNLTTLRYLHLSNNNISSSIPSTIWSLRYVLKIDISANSLDGSVPTEIGNLKVLLSFDASDNKLSGTLPDTFENLQDLTYISLANNGFQGPIPESFGQLKSLEVLNLSRNAFSGTVPKSLESLTSIKSFNVSFNDLEGEIPTEGIFKNLSVQSFLGNHALCGHPMKQCRNKARSSSKYYILAATVITAVLSITVVAIIAAKRRKKRSANAPDDENPSTLAAFRRISMLELERATNIFHDANLLGVGTFGKVYKGTLSDGITVAVKTFNMDLEEGMKSFDVECEVLREFRHRNLVKVISSCCNIDFKALVLEYMPKGSLEKWLYSHNYFLDIVQRLNIMIDVGAGLEYLHNGHSSAVVHCDLKPSNVLLDEDMVAHVSDFGIAKLLGEEKSMTKTLTLATIGYMAPEYGSVGNISTKGDVYSFGILLMETFTRKKPTDADFAGEMNLKRWVKDSLPDAVADVVDWNLLRREERNFEAKISCVSSILQLALECCADSPEDRGNMKDVLAEMTKIKTKFPKDTRRA